MSMRGRSSFGEILRRHGGPVVVWVVAVVVVVGMLTRRSTIVEVQGLVRAPSVQVSPIEAGQLASIEVGLLQDVRRGQIVARMDDTLLRADAALVAAEVEAIRRELVFDLKVQRQDEVSELRRFTTDVEAARLRVIEVLTVLEPDRITLADLDRNVASYSELLNSELVSVREFEREVAERDALAQKVSEHDSLLDRARRDLAEAETRRTGFLHDRPESAEGSSEADPVTELLSARVTALERRLDMVAVRRDDLWLTAPFDGVVVQIPACPGQVLQPGEPVLTLAQARAEEIIVWLDEASVDRLKRRGDLSATVIQTRGGKHVRAECNVARIGPTIVTLPPELWPLPNRPSRGRPVVLGLPAALDLVPGELVTVRWG